MSYQNTQVANVSQMMADQNARNNLATALPSHITPQKFMQVVSTAAMLNPELEECTYSSLMSSFLQCAKDGLLPDNKEAAIVVYNKKQGNQWVKVAQYQPMVMGVLKRLRQSSEVNYIDAKIVYQGDQFDYYVDMEGEKLIHRPVFEKEQRGDIRLVYAMAKLKTGDNVVEVMTKDEVDRIMMMSKSAVDRDGNLKQYSVWAQHYGEMMRKTAIHRIAKRLPNSSDVMDMIEREVQLKGIEQKTTQIHQVANNSQVNSQQVQELQGLSQTAQADLKAMFSWVSARTGRVANDFGELTIQQYEILKHSLQRKIENVSNQNNAVVNGTVVQ